MGLANRHPAVVVRKVRNPEPTRAIHAALREKSPGRSALGGLLNALKDQAGNG